MRVYTKHARKPTLGSHEIPSLHSLQLDKILNLSLTTWWERPAKCSNALADHSKILAELSSDYGL